MKDAATDEAAILAEIYAEIDAIHASYATNPPPPRLNPQLNRRPAPTSRTRAPSTPFAITTSMKPSPS